MAQLNDHGLLKSQALINGRWRDALSGQTLSVTNPATGESIGTVPKLGKQEALDAVAAAEQAHRLLLAGGNDAELVDIAANQGLFFAAPDQPQAARQAA